MKTTLRIATGLMLCASTFLSAQHTTIHQGTSVSAPSSKILGPSNSNTPTGVANPGQDVQMTTCTDKVTYVDRHAQANQDAQVGGTMGWWSTMQTFPSFSGTITEAYATMKKVGANVPVTLFVWAMNSSGHPTGAPLDSVAVTVTSNTYAEYGGVLSVPATVATYGFCVGVWVEGSNFPDSVMVALHNDPESNGLNYYYYQTLNNALTDLFEASDFLIRAKISYTAPTQTVTASPTTGCAGTPINFSLNQTGTPAFYSSVWASPNAPTYSWDFGDAGTSTIAAPTHSYASSGSYTVSSTKTNAGWTTSCPSAAATTTVSITGATASVSIACTPTGFVCPTQTVNFNATPTNGGTGPTYVWKKNGIQVGTGSAFSGSSWAGNDVMTCEMVSNAACAPASPVVSNAITMYLQPLSFSSFNYSSTGLSVVFTSTAANAVSWAWNFGDAGTSASATPVHNYATGGTYTVDLTVTNSCGQTTVSSINITISSTTNTSGGNTGIHEKELQVNVNAFPNPVNNDLNINYSINHPTDVTIEVFNALGQAVSTQAIKTTSTGTAHVAMENMAAGLYFVRFTAGENNVQMLRVVHE